jgi:4-hydroxymandelate oxidase
MSKKDVKRDEETGKSFSRREFIASAAVMGAGAVAFTGLTKQVVLAQAQDTKPVAPLAKEGAPKVSDAKKLEEVLKVAREKLYPRCRVCPECDGVACGGEVPGMGGIGSGSSFRNNFKALAVYTLQMRTLHDVAKPDTSIMLFGQKLSMPILCASTGGTTYNMGLAGKMSEEDYINAILGGAVLAGTIGLAADGIEDPLDVYKKRLDAIKANGKGIAIMKPKGQDEVFEKIKLIEQSGAVAFGMDVDGAGRAARALPGQIVEPKNMKKLRAIVNSTKVPFMIKGIMTADEAQMAIDAGAAAIVVSNHGGRVLDHTPGTAAVLPNISAKVKGKITILVDGGIRNGYDVLKMLALGADAVMIGRPVIRGAVGGGKDGVALVLNMMRKQLAEAMVMTGVASVQKVERSVVA